MSTTSFDRYRSSLAHVEVLDATRERALARRFRDGDTEAGRLLVESSLPFVIRIAKEYRRWGVPFEDLVQQGNVGLLRAALKFDPSRECRLVTYAVYWIRAEIRDHVVRSHRIVRLGTTRTERRALRAHRRRAVRSPQELAEAGGMPIGRAEKLWPLLEGGDVSLDQEIGGRAPAVERIASVGGDPEEEASRREEVTLVRRALADTMRVLSARERRIVDERLMADEPRTLESLGAELGVSKERVRQLEGRVLQRLQAALFRHRPAA